MSTEDQTKDGDQNKQGDDFVPPKDGSWVPRQRMNEAVDKATAPLQQKTDSLIAENARLKEQINNKGTEEQNKKIYTLPELRAFVEKEQISQAQADGIYEQQQKDSVKLQVDTAVKDHLTTSDDRRAVETKLDAYLQVLPDLMSEGSDNRAKVATEYTRLSGIFGLPAADSLEDKKLQVEACHAAFGDATQFKQHIERDISKKERETEQGLGSNDGETITDEDQKTMKKLDAKQKKYYQSMIDKKFYKDWKEVGEVMKYAKR